MIRRRRLCVEGVYKSSGVVEIVITTVQLRKIAKVIKSKVFVRRAVAVGRSKLKTFPPPQ